MKMLSPVLKYLVWMICFVLCESFTQDDLVKSGVFQNLNFGSAASGASLFSPLSSLFTLNKNNKLDEASTSSSNDDSVMSSLGEGKNSVLDSLFEINARDYKNSEGGNESFVVSGNKRKGQVNDTSTSIFQDISFFPLVKDKHAHHNTISPENESLMNHLNSIRSEAWSNFKSIVLTYVNSLDSSADKDHMKDSYAVKFMLKLLDMGDNINFIHILGRKIDPQVSKFLLETLKNSSPEMLGLKNVNESNIHSIMPTVNKLVNQLAWLSLKHIINHLLEKIKSRNSLADLDKYISDLKSTNPFAAQGLQFVLNLPSEMPSYNSNGEGRSLERGRKTRPSSRDGYGYDDDIYGYHDDGYSDDHGGYVDISYDHKEIGYGHKDIGYDHKDIGYGHKEIGYGHKDIGYGHKDTGYGDFGSHDSYGHGGGGYKSPGIQLDPYLILAGIGTAALLAFVAFQIFTTAPAKKRRSVDDPDVVSHILNAIEDGQTAYETTTEEMVDAVNILWKKRSINCSLCSLFQFLTDKLKDRDNVKLIIISAFASLFGMEKPGQLLDEMADRFLKNKPLTCDTNSCTLKK